MGRGPDPHLALHNEVNKRAAEFFEPRLRDLKLAADQIQEFSIAELEEALVRIDDAMQHPEQFGTLRMTATVKTGNLALMISGAASEAQFEVGILPILLERKAMILDRIKVLRPADQLAHLKTEIVKTIVDEDTRTRVFRILDAQEAKQQQITDRLEQETKKVDDALETERQATLQTVSLAKLEVRLESVDKLFGTRIEATEKAISKLEDKAVSKWDVVTIVFATLAALGGLVGVIIALIKWISGG